MSARRRKWYWFALATSALATLYCYSGVVMNAHFSMSGSAAQAAGHILAAKIFAALTVVGLLSTFLYALLLWQNRKQRRQA